MCLRTPLCDATQDSPTLTLPPPPKMPELQLVDSTPEVIEDLRCKLTDPTASLPEKYRVLFSLRNVKGQLAQEALLQGKQRCRRHIVHAHTPHTRSFTTKCCAFCSLPAALKDESALFRHDVAFCLGQRQDPASVATLKAILLDPQEHCM